MFRRILIIAALCCALPIPAAADSPALMGAMGLITVPSARMDPSGTVRAHVGMAEPYVHATASVQIAEPLYIGVRQSARTSSLRGDPDRLYPGVDLRLRLLKESTYVPDVTLGLQSAIGHRRMAAEYLVLSKRYEDWDFTGGVAWGRLGNAAHISNPLKAVSHHFGKRRALDGEMPNGPEDWFTGEDVGFFAGIEYDAPWIEGLSIKAEWGADRYIAEQAAFGHDAPEPWALGVAYQPKDWVNIGAALIGGDRVMASLSLQSPIKKWFGRSDKIDTPQPLRPHRAGLAIPGEITQAAAAQNIMLADTNNNHELIWTRMEADPHTSLPRQLGRAGRAIANSGGTSVEAIEITPMLYGLRGPSVRLLRRDLEQAFARDNGSPQEIWRNAVFNRPEAKKRDGYFKPRLADARENLRVIWDTQMSLAEEDNGVLYRTGIIAETRQQLTRNLMTGAGLRVNLAGNLEKLNLVRPR
ncbi:MAG: YjbH domain-containing protein, partial [Alphaproteobacteria bacterium]|nr:YjbH domain-containing protein [Alphaproteobacteria bacterium]